MAMTKKPSARPYYKKVKPGKSGSNCPTCGKALFDFELLQGCINCAAESRRLRSISPGKYIYRGMTINEPLPGKYQVEGVKPATGDYWHNLDVCIVAINYHLKETSSF